MPELYEAPQCEELLLLFPNPIALSEGEEDDDFQGGVPFGLRDTFETYTE